MNLHENGMSTQTLPVERLPVSARWRQRLILVFIVACFAVPLAAAWLLVGRWQPDGSVQHGELLNPARPIPTLRFDSPAGQPLDGMALRGHWVLIYVGSATACDERCRTALYDMRQVRLALGKDMGRVKTVLLQEGSPEPDLRRWLADEHAAMIVGAADAASRTALTAAFAQPGAAGDWIYLLDPLGNLLMRYPVTVEPRGMLKDLQRLLRLSKIG